MIYFSFWTKMATPMRIAVFVICLAFTSTAYGGKCQNLARYILLPTGTVLQTLVAQPIFLHRIAKLVLMPQKELALRPGIEVVGPLTGSKKNRRANSPTLRKLRSCYESLKPSKTHDKNLRLQKKYLSKLY